MKVDRIAQVADHRHQPLPRKRREAGGVELRAGIGERHTVPDPRRAACHAKRYTRLVVPPLRPHGVAPVPAVRARPSHAAGNGTRHTTWARTGSMRIRLFSP